MNRLFLTLTLLTTLLTELGEQSIALAANDDQNSDGNQNSGLTGSEADQHPKINLSRSTATLQYSDTIGSVLITATHVYDDALVLSSTWSKDSDATNNGLPLGLSAAGGCNTAGNSESPSTGTHCSWTLSGQMLEPAGKYTITFTVTDENSGGGEVPALTDSGSTELIVNPENASIAFDGSNPLGVKVAADGSDPGDLVSIHFDVWETTPDTATFTQLAGDISKAMPEKTVKLQPVGPGSPVSPVRCTEVSTGSSGYAEVITTTCQFEGVSVNSDSLDVSINGGYFTGAGHTTMSKQRSVGKNKGRRQ